MHLVMLSETRFSYDIYQADIDTVGWKEKAALLETPPKVIRLVTLEYSSLSFIYG